jgi:hypothetical protein
MIAAADDDLMQEIRLNDKKVLPDQFLVKKW